MGYILYYCCSIFKKIIYKKLYTNTDLSYTEFDKKCNTKNMMNKLPAHDLSEPWYLSTDCTADIKNIKQIKILEKFL